MIGSSNMAFNNSLCLRLVEIADNLALAAEAGDFERVDQLDHTLRHTAMELVATLELQGDNLGSCIDAMIHAMNSVKQASHVLETQSQSLNEKFKNDIKLRLVYSRKGS